MKMNRRKFFKKEEQQEEITYTELDYIITSNNNFIETNLDLRQIIDDCGTDFDIEFKVIALPKSFTSIFYNNSNIDKMHSFGYSYSSYDNIYKFKTFNGFSTSMDTLGININSGVEVVGNIIYDNDKIYDDRFILKINDKKGYILNYDYTEKNIQFLGIIIGKNMFLLGGYNHNSPTNYRLRKSNGYFCYMKIKDGNELLHEFKPFIDSNNIPCIIDTVTNTVYYNSAPNYIGTQSTEFGYCLNGIEVFPSDW